jgi:TFIIF-interacting CTD phosphatase-like protein
MRDFLEYLKKSKEDGTLEPIIYSTGTKFYIDKLMDIVDPKKEIFEHVLYQNACYALEKPDEDIHLLIKDIGRFQNRDLKRSILLDPRALCFIMNPENGYPVVPYSAEYQNKSDGPKDEYLLALMDELDLMKVMDDVRPYLDETYKVR